jgi:WD40 repeat protein
MTSNASEPTFDAFLSYVEEDRAWAEGYLRDALTHAGCRCLAESDLPLGEPRLLALEEAVQRSRRVLLIVSPAYLAAADPLIDLLARAHGEATRTWPVVPVIRRRAQLPPRLSLLVALDASEPALWEEVLARLCAELRRPLPGPAEHPRCPYPGMVPFGEGQALFFGRERETDSIVASLRLHRFLAVIGPSGSGKSSLVLAGVVPELRRSSLFGPGGWDVCTLRPGEDPTAELRALLARELPAPPRAPTLTSGGAAVSLGAPAGNLLLVADQFEASFVHPREVWEPFQRELLEISRRPGCYLVLTVRADFYADLMNSPLWPEVKEHRMEALPLAGDALRDAIVKPAAAMRCFVETALVERLVGDAAREPGALPFVQETLVLLWDRLQRRFLSLAAYEALGTGERSGLQVAIARRADAVLSELAPDQQQLARRILLRLVQFGEGRADTRRRQSRAALRSAGDAPAVLDAVVDQLAAWRLLTLGGGEGALGSVDLAHEALLSGWPKLQQWVAERREAEQVRRRLEDKALEWRERVTSGLGGGQLDQVELLEAERWQAGIDAQELGFSGDLVELIAASRETILADQAAKRAAQERERAQAQQLAREARRFRRLAVFLAVALVAAVGAVGLAVRQTGISQSRQLAAQAFSMLGRKLDEGMLLSASAYLKNVNTDSYASLAAAMQQSGRLVAFLHGNRAFVWSLAFSGDSKTLAAVSADGTITLWDIESRRLRCGHPILANAKQAFCLAFAPHRNVLATAGEDRILHLWDTDRCSELHSRQEAHQMSVLDLAFSPDGRILASTSHDGKVLLWDGQSLLPLPQQLSPPSAHPSPMRSVAFSSDGSLLAAGDVDGKIFFWNVATRQLAGPATEEHEDTVNVLRFSPVDRILASASDDAQAILWDCVTRRTIASALGRGKAPGHTAGIMGMAFSPDGRTLATAGSDMQIRLWNTSKTSVAPEVLGQHHAQINAVAISPDGRLLASAGWDGDVILWDMTRPHRLASSLAAQPDHASGIAASHDGKVWATVDASGNVLAGRAGQLERFSTAHGPPRTAYRAVRFRLGGMLASAGEDGTVSLWDARTREALGEPLRGHDGQVNAVAFSPDGDKLASAGADGTVVLWSAVQHQQLAVLRGHLDDVKALAFSPAGDRLASASDDHSVIVWDVRNRKLLARLLEHTGSVSAVAFSADGRFIASGGSDQRIVIWDAARFVPAASHKLHGAVEDLRFSPVDRRLLASVDDGNHVALWDTRDARPVRRELPAMSGADYCLAFSPDGKRLAVGGYQVYLVDLASRALLPSPVLPQATVVRGVDFSADGRLAAATDGQQILIWEGALSSVPSVLSGIAVSAMALGPDGSSLALGDSRGMLRTWDLRSHKPIGPAVATGQVSLKALAFSADARFLASAGADKSVRLWQMPACTAVGQPLGGFSGELNAVAFSADSRMLAAAGGDDGLIRLWRVDGLREAPPLKVHVRKVLALTFSPRNSALLASGGMDRNALLWDLRRNPRAQGLPGHSAAVTALAFTPDGRMMATGGEDRFIMLWDTAGGDRIGTWMMAPAPVRALAFLTPEILLSVGSDRAITRWDLSPQSWCEIARRVANLPPGSGDGDQR